MARTTRAQLSHDRDRELLRQMLRIRRFEERRVELCGGGAPSRALPSPRSRSRSQLGEEAVAAGVCHALDPEDAVVSVRWEHGPALARGVPARTIMAQACARARGAGPTRLVDPGRRFYGGDLHGDDLHGSGLSLAVGLATADRLLRRPRVTACFLDEDATARDELRDCLDLAARWRLPVLLACENSRHASPSAAHDAVTRPSDGYGVVVRPVDGTDVRAVADAAAEACAAIRAGGGPHLLSLRTHRLHAPTLYDPLDLITLPGRETAELEQEIAQELDEATGCAGPARLRPAEV
ncbi:thiamine pyrophosphate-dependent enzyme [Actinomadura sp. ATCC 31491]|uniref:Thiamine pyrophosphate-dependent enzyme n=1 Tax=Actinomadura luzonensis TaxID=2805427 RepID=A0ABT0G1W3_9ACTN|nr:thiamine pyrophosphate-dependent enzyme [Actinomadura luzonensis]MCK2218600.1 thiamine pyrophosphate-dependent enzyme [Actinomadura luzonensis]